MAAPYTGRCNCGAITATISAEPLAVRQCWCRRCQKIAAGGSSRNAMFLVEAVELHGETKAAAYVADSGNTLTQHFCPDCGTHVFSQSSARMHMCTFRFGFLDPNHGLRPDMVIWTSEAPEWAVFDPTIQQVAGQPAAPAVTKQSNG